MSASEQATVSKGRAILTVLLCCLVAMMEGIDLQAPGLTLPILGPMFKMSAGHGLDLGEKGWFLSMSTFGLMVGAAIGGRASDLIGRKWVLILAASLFGLFSILTAFSTSTHMLMAMRFLTGLGLGGAFPNLIALAAENVSQSKRHTAIGFLYASMPVGGGSASLIAAVFSGAQQWPVVYLVGGIAPLLIVPLLMLFLPGGKPAQNAQEHPAGRSIATALFGEGRAARTLLLWLAFFLALLVMYLLLGWLPSLMGTRGLSHAQASTVQIAFNWVGAAGSILIGFILDRNRSALTVGLVFAASAAALIYLAGAPGDLLLMIIGGGLVGATISGVQTLLYGIAPSCYPTHVRGTGVGFAVAVGRLGSAAGPLLASVLVGAGQSAAQVLMALVPILAVSALASIMAVSLVKSRPVGA